MTYSSPVITVSIVTFHTPLTKLEAGLASLRACTLPIEAIIVDNTPGTEYFAGLPPQGGQI